MSSREIDASNRSFFWKSNIDSDNGQGSILLISWYKLCRLKCEEGLGIRKIQDINATLLAKLRWKVLTDLDNIWVKVVSVKNLTKGNFLEVKEKLMLYHVEYILDHRTN